MVLDLGLIDPENQSKAMLAKLLVRRLLPGNETWKMILQSRIGGLVPKNGGPWQPCIRWAFLKGGRVSTSKALEDRFLNSVLIAWSAVKEGMQHRKPTTEQEIDRQPLFWNPWFTSWVQSMLGTRTRLSWGPFEAGLARTFRDWKIVCSFQSLEREQILKRYKGGKIIFREI